MGLLIRSSLHHQHLQAAMATRSPLRLSIQSVDLPTPTPTLGRYRHSSVFLRPRFPKPLLTSKGTTAPKPLLTSKGTTAACHCVPKGTYVPLSQKAGAENLPMLFTLYIVLLFSMYTVLLFPSILRRLHNLLPYPRQTLMIPEFVGTDYNFMYPAVDAYLHSKIGHTLMVLDLFTYEGQKGFTLDLPEYHEIEDVFQGTPYSWRLVRLGKRDQVKYPKIFRPVSRRGTRAFNVTFYHAEQEKTLKSYFPLIKAAFLKAKDVGSTIRVTNLSKDAYQSDLYNLFNNFGPISSVSIGYEQKTGMSRVLGVVNFVHKGDAEKAISKLNGHEYNNLILGVEWAEQQSNIAKVEWVAL